MKTIIIYGYGCGGSNNLDMAEGSSDRYSTPEYHQYGHNPFCGDGYGGGSNYGEGNGDSYCDYGCGDGSSNGDGYGNSSCDPSDG
jgi:hypothetical protein